MELGYTYIEKQGKNEMAENRYELVITDEGSSLWDLNNFRFYCFEE